MQVLHKQKGFAQVDLLLWGVVVLTMLAISITAVNRYVIPVIHKYQLMDYGKQNFSALESYYWGEVGDTQCYSTPTIPSATDLISDGYLNSDVIGDSFFMGGTPTYRFVTNSDNLFPIAFEIDIDFYDQKDASRIINNPYFKKLDGTIITLIKSFDIRSINPDVMAFIGSDGCM